MSEAENIGDALKIILKRLQEETNKEINKEELPHTCNNCKYCHGVEGYDQEWGRTYCVQSWCDKDRSLMNSIKNNTKHYMFPCEYFEIGEGKYDRINKRR